MTNANKESESMDAQAGELGRLLQGYRESIGYSVTQTADALCLSEAIVVKLENEDFDTLAEPPYIRGYLRNYAKLAEKDPSVLIDTYENLRGASPEELTNHYRPIAANITNKRKPPLFPIFAKLAVAAVIIAGLVSVAMIPQVKNWFVDTWHSFSQQNVSRMNGNIESINNPLLTGNMPAPLPIPIEETISESTTQQQTDTSAEVKPQDSAQTDSNKTEENKTTKTSSDETDQEQTTKTSDSTDVTEKNKESSTDTKSESQADASPAGNTVKIKLVFNQEVWLRIKDKDKKTVYEAQTGAGNEKELELEKPLTFRVGNAQGISIFIDGKIKDIKEFTKGSVANFTLQ